MGGFPPRDDERSVCALAAAGDLMVPRSGFLSKGHLRDAPFARDDSVPRALRTRFNSRAPPRGIKSRRAESIVVERASPEWR